MRNMNKDPLNCIQYPLLKSSPALKSPVPAGACQPTTNTAYFTTGWYAPANVLPGWGMDETCNKPGSPGTSDSCFSGLAGNPSTGGAVNNDPNNCLSDKMIKTFPGLKVPSGVCEKDLSGTFASGWFAPAYKTGTPINQSCNPPTTPGTNINCFDPVALSKDVPPVAPSPPKPPPPPAPAVAPSPPVQSSISSRLGSRSSGNRYYDRNNSSSRSRFGNSKSGFESNDGNNVFLMICVILLLVLLWAGFSKN